MRITHLTVIVSGVEMDRIKDAGVPYEEQSIGWNNDKQEAEHVLLVEKRYQDRITQASRSRKRAVRAAQ